MNTSDQQTEKTSAFIESVTVNEPNNKVHWFGSYFPINSSGSGNGVLTFFLPHICILSSFCSKTRSVVFHLRCFRLSFQESDVLVTVHKISWFRLIGEKSHLI